MISVPGAAGWKPLCRPTRVLLAEEVHDALEIVRREPPVDRRLDVGVKEMLLHRAEVSAPERLSNSTAHA
jgi:hypothetical protein